KGDTQSATIRRKRMTGSSSRLNSPVGTACRKLLTKAVPAVAVVLAALAPTGRPAAAASGHDYQYCSGYFALCAASTCTATGRELKVNVTGGGTAFFPEADCTCPIFSGEGVADLAGGNMQGSCKPPVAPDGSVGVWSYYAVQAHIAQQLTGWVATGPKAP